MIKEQPLTRQQLETFVAHLRTQAPISNVLGVSVLETTTTFVAKSVIRFDRTTNRDLSKQPVTIDELLETFASACSNVVDEIVLCGDKNTIGDDMRAQALRLVDGLIANQPLTQYPTDKPISGHTMIMHHKNTDELRWVCAVKTWHIPEPHVVVVGGDAVKLGVTNATLFEHLDKPGKYSMRIGLHLSIDRSKVHVYSC